MKNRWNDCAVVVVIIVLGVCSWLANTELANIKEELNTQGGLLESAQEELVFVTEKLHKESRKSDELAVELDCVTKDLGTANETILALKNTEYELVYMGEFKLTHYCTEEYRHICGLGAGITATGTKVTAGRTVAVDPTVIPYGTQIYIEGYGWRTAEDCGGAVKNKQIDIAVDTHDNALSMGTTNGGVWMLIKKDS